MASPKLKSTTQSPPPTPPYISPTRKTPSPGVRPARPPSPDTCPICLDVLDEKKDRCYSNSCFHMFCFICLLEWSKNKRECPLCKKPFKSIYHKIESHDKYEEYKLPPPPPQPALNESRWPNISWEWMSHMRRMYILNRQRQIARIRSGSYRQPTLGERNVLRPATSDYRRYIYSRDLYCEGAHPPGSQRYRRVTPEFYRQNPACLHRLVPWLNRELLAILPHRDNVQYVLDHIVKEIKRVDMRSDEFRRSIEPFILSNTDHFVHEFHQFAMSPLDMAGFDKYAKYPTRPRRNMGQTEPSNSTLSRSPSDASVRAREASAYSSNSLRRSASSLSTSIPLLNPLRGPYSQSFTSRTSGNSVSRSRDSGSSTSGLHTQGSSRWDSPPTSSSSATQWDPSQSSAHFVHHAARLSRNQRDDLNRLERTLMSLDGARRSSNPYLHDLSPSPEHRESRDEILDNYRQLMSRVRSFLSQTADDTENMDMPILGQLTGELAADQQLPCTSRESTNQPGPSYARIPSPSTPTTADTQQPRSPSPVSSHSSDCIIIGVEKPFSERSPIELSSESDDERKVRFNAEAVDKIRRLSYSSTSSQSSPKKADRFQRKRVHSPDLSESSSGSPAKMSKKEISQLKAVYGIKDSGSSSRSRSRSSSMDSDCIVMYQSGKVNDSKHGKNDEGKRQHRDHSEKRKDKRKKKKKHKERHHHKHKDKSDKASGRRKKDKRSSHHYEKHRHQKDDESKLYNAAMRMPSHVSDPTNKNSDVRSCDEIAENRRQGRNKGSSSNDSADNYINVCDSENGVSTDINRGNSAASLSDRDESCGESVDDAVDQSYGKHTDIRKGIRHYAQTHIAKKYEEPSRKYKKHDKGHKNSQQ